jgi:hypothetical protein
VRLRARRWKEGQGVEVMVSPGVGVVTCLRCGRIPLTSRQRLPNRTRGRCQNAWRVAPVSRSRITGSTSSVVAGSARRGGALGRADVVRRRMLVLAPRILPRGERQEAW